MRDGKNEIEKERKREKEKERIGNRLKIEYKSLKRENVMPKWMSYQPPKKQNLSQIAKHKQRTKHGTRKKEPTTNSVSINLNFSRDRFLSVTFVSNRI